jgi:secondary thiamine-phosphate synthase enzyme
MGGRAAHRHVRQVMKTTRIHLTTKAREEILIVTGEINAALASLTDGEGICTVVTPHTTCAISVNENADPDVLTDLTRAFRAMIPDVRFEHGEGNSDAHLLSTIIGPSLSWPYRAGSLILGTWQGVYFIELDGPRRRHIDVYIV